MQPPKSRATDERYEVLELLGRGGMGSVFRVRDRKSGRVLALKRLKSRRARTGVVDMFHAEYRTLAQLQHPHVVDVYDFGIDGAGPYYTMAYLSGSDLQTLAPLPWREVCALGRDVCSALALLHSRRLVHRDPSPRNIKRVEGGRAKLIDFGGLMSMGVAANMVGTAPLVAPEVLMQNPLDARTDLYALGATLYFALTGRHAYPVRTLTELNAIWRVPPAAPSSLDADVPAELDHLILSMLNLEPGARPRSAAEVLDRLSAIAELPHEEQAGVPSAYLEMPELVGRQTELTQLRARFRELHAGQGGVVWIAGEPGVGRSRMVAAAALEAKLLGARVVTARADGSGATYGLLRELAVGLGEDDASGPLQRILAGGLDPEFDRACRSQLQDAFSSSVRARAVRAPVVLAIDDIDRADEPSQAALAWLAREATDARVLVVFSSAAELGSAPAPALSLLAGDALRVELRPLRGEETRALLSSMFGDVPNLAALAVRIHALAEGSPRGAVELAQYLASAGRVHYELGAWVLPAQAGDASLPSSRSLARSCRLQALSPEARLLAEELAFADGAGMPACVYAELAPRALGELLRGQIVQREGSHYAFEAQVWVTELKAGVPAERARETCRRIAAALARHDRDPVDVARYHWLAGDTRALVETLLAELRRGSRWDRAHADYAAMLATAVEACSALDRSQRDWFVLLRELVKVGQDLSVPRLGEHLRALLGQLEFDAGLSDDVQVAWSLLAPAERMQRTLELAQRRYDAAPEHARGLAPLEAVHALTWLVSETSALAAQTGDLALLDLLPSLEPFVPLARAVEHVQREVVPATRDLIAGRFEAAVASYRRSLRLVRGPDTDLFDDATRAWAGHVLNYALGCLDAALGRPQALEHAAELEASPQWLVPAWTIRHIYHGAVGNVREAERCRKHVELVLLQSAVRPPLVAGAAQQHVYTASLCEDVTGLRHCIAELGPLAQQHPVLAPFLEFARAEHARACGDATQALELYAAIGGGMEAGEYPLWARVRGCQIAVLHGVGRYDEAFELGRRCLAEAERAGLEGMKHFVEVPFAMIQDHFGQHDEARGRIDAVIRAREHAGFSGIPLAWLYECRARLALWQRDEAGFEQYAMLCRQHYKKTGGNPALAAKYERLMQEARQTGARVEVEVESAETSSRSTSTGSLHTMIERDRDLVHKLRLCRGPKERAQTALALLLERAKVRHGDLYLLHDTGLALAASTAASVDEVSYTLARRLVEPAEASAPHSELESAVLPLLLTYKSRGSTWLVGVAVFREDHERMLSTSTPLAAASALAKALAEIADATPKALVARG